MFLFWFGGGRLGQDRLGTRAKKQKKGRAVWRSMTSTPPSMQKEEKGRKGEGGGFSTPSPRGRGKKDPFVRAPALHDRAGEGGGSSGTPGRSHDLRGGGGAPHRAVKKNSPPRRLRRRLTVAGSPALRKGKKADQADVAPPLVEAQKRGGGGGKGVGTTEGFSLAGDLRTSYYTTSS